MDTLQTCTWMVTRLDQLGYSTSDNASRILEGSSFSKDRGNITELYVRVTLESSEECHIILRFTK